MRLRHIEIFNAVYAVGSVSGAARYLNISQPTASKILKHAEDRIGFKLFRRIKGQLIPTEEANVLYEETRRITDQVTHLQKMARNLNDAKKGHIKLGSISALGLEHIPRAIIAFQQQNPDVHFEFQTRHYDNLVTAIQQQEKDVGIAFNAQSQKGLERMEIGSGEFVCAYSGDEFADRPGRIAIADIAEHDLVGIEKSGPLGDLLSQMIDDAGIAPRSTLTSHTYIVARNLVAMGGGIAIVDEFTATSHGAGEVKYKKFDPPLRFKVHAIHREMHPPSRLMKNFLMVLRKELARSRLD